MSRVTLVLNHHGTPSETFQRALAATLIGGGHEVTIHALLASSNEVPPVPGVQLSSALPQASSPGALLAGLLRSVDRQTVRVGRRAVSRFGWTARAARAALQAAPILATDPDVVHLGFSGIGVGMIDALDLLGPVPVIVSCRGTDELVRPLLQPSRAAELAALFDRVDAIHVVAAAVGDAVEAMGADPEKVTVIRPAIDLDRWVSATPPVDGPPWLVVSVTRLVPAKGIDDLVAAVAIVRASGVDLRARIIGDGPQRDALALRIQRLGLGASVTLLGSRAPEEIATELAAAHLFVSPSLSEGISNGVLEAMGAGVAVVSTDVGGMAEVITSGTDGWLVPAGRPDLLADLVVRALPDRAEVGAAGRRRVQGAFARAHQSAEWLALYGDVVGRAGQAGPAQRDRRGRQR